MPEWPDAGFLLEWAREAGMAAPLLDFHVHPFDVLTGDTAYRPDDRVDGLYGKGASAYRPPDVQAGAGGPKSPPAGSITERSLLLAARLAYAHTGPLVLGDHLDAAGFAEALLLPVARAPGAAEALSAATAAMYPDGGRWHSACAFPVGVPPDRLGSYFSRARQAWGVRAIKLHPNLAGIDPLEDSGRALMEAMLVAAGELGLTVVVHGGRTPGLPQDGCGSYGTLAHLAEVDWGASSAPVIVAHGGLYGLADDEAIAGIQALEGLLDRFPNLMADTSTLEPPVLWLLLERIDRRRLVFGSDALYVPIWKAWVRFLATLRLVSPRPDEDLVRIAALNPARCLEWQGVSDGTFRA
jgi:predicted TIM-barrel fold metal-dependent hydrolase